MDSKAAELTPRTPDEIKAEYQNVCGMVGEMQFKKLAMESDITRLNQRLVALHNEHAAVTKPVEEAKSEAVS